MKKIVAFNSSPRARGNTQAMLSDLLERLTSHPQIEGELIHIGGKAVYGCRGCGACRKNQDRRCIITEDDMNSYIAAMIEADVILLGSPTYYATLTPEMKALMDRAGTVTRANGGLLRRKIGASLTAVRRAGGINTFNSMNNFFLINEMIIPGSSYWNMSLARNVGEYEQDEEGMQTMANLAEAILFLVERL